ncbi:MAG: PqqD family protein [Spirochaetales bacterium]|nr:PqqD family protein [Spirochaetales bacterium]
MELSETYKAASDVISTEMDGESVLMHVAKGKYFSLNETGSVIWKKLEEGPLTLGQMIEAIQAEFEVEADQCQKDLEGLIKTMMKKGVLEKVS